MKVITYARVSTLSQESEGESLANQRRAFGMAADRFGWKVARHYEEAASAGTVEGRAQFARMIADLPKTKPHAIIVDTLDRFTRNLRDGMNLLEELRGHGVGLLPLDWQRTTPLNLDEDRDWADVVEEFTTAEKERRRISKRVKRSYEGRRERGAVLANRTPFGLLRQGDRFVPGKQVWIVREAEDRALRGEPLLRIVDWLRATDDDAWGSVRGLKDAFANEHYVMAGARSVERHRALAGFLQVQSLRHGQRRKFDHEFTGVFLCGECSELMYGRTQVKRGRTFSSVVCSRIQDTDEDRHYFSVAVTKIGAEWERYLHKLATSRALLEQWANRGNTDDTQRERDLQRRLATFDQRLAALKQRRDTAFDMLGESGTVAKQARKLLQDVERDEMEIAVQREAILGELARTTSAPKRDPYWLHEQLRQYLRVYCGADVPTRNRLNLGLVTAIGSRPRVYKVGAEPLVEWTELENLKSPAELSQPLRQSRG